MKPRSLPTSFASEPERARRVAEAVNGLIQRLEQNGATAARPGAPGTGEQYFDTTLGKPIWWNGSGWVLADGTAA